MAALPNAKGLDLPINAYVSDALHFRRGIRAYPHLPTAMPMCRLLNPRNFFFLENFRVWDTEWEIPVPAKGGKRDYNMVQRAWYVSTSSVR